ncbi:MAG TPA: hypothetical protein VMB85_13520 [Bryobacteraceae bacterium]|nr:hypothetical protein [Bryobacteraceae bacterium]
MADQETSNTNRVAEKIEETRDAAANAMHGASESIRRNAENLPGGSTVSGMAHSAADRIDDAADYLAEHDTRELLSEARWWVRHHPGKALLGAAAVGFFAGRIFRAR